MAFADHFLPLSAHRHDFDFTLSPRRNQPARPEWETPDEHERLMDCEFSEMGRNPRFVPGWYVLPGLAMGAIILGFVLWSTLP